MQEVITARGVRKTFTLSRKQRMLDKTGENTGVSVLDSFCAGLGGPKRSILVDSSALLW